MISESELIKGCVENKRKYQEMLYRRFFPRMMSMCMRYTQDPDKVSMIINDGFLKVFKKIHTFKSSGSFEGWIRRLVFHAISDFYKKENKYLKFLVFEEAEKRTQEQTLSKLYFDDIVAHLDGLPDRSAEVFELFAIEGFKHTEIAEKLNISTGTSKWHLSEARSQLKKLLQNQYIKDNRHVR